MKEDRKTADVASPLERIVMHFGDEMVKMAGYDDCVEGVCIRFGQEPIIIYSYEMIIAKLEKDMTPEEAVEFFECNQFGAWVGDRTPCFLVNT